MSSKWNKLVDPAISNNNISEPTVIAGGIGNVLNTVTDFE